MDYKEPIEILEENKIKILHSVYRNVFVILIFGTILTSLFSTYTDDVIKENITYYIIYFAIAIAIVYMNKLIVKNIELKYFIYALLVMFTYAFLIYVLRDKYMVPIAPILPALFLTIFFTYRLRYIAATGILIMLISYYFYTVNPTPTVNLGIGYYITYVVSAVYSISLSARALKLIRWYDKKLMAEIQNVSAKNEELIALNEEYYAAQEELHHNYDEIIALNQSEKLVNQKLDALIDATEDGIIEYNISTDEIIYSSKAIGLLSLNEVSSLSDFVKKLKMESKKMFNEAWLKLLEHEESRIQININLIDNRSFEITMIIFKTVTEEEYIICALKDITLLKSHERHIIELAYNDSLTKLYNRHGLLNELEDYISKGAKGFFLCIVDVDNFKYINNIFGYSTGDEILKQIAYKLHHTSFLFITRVTDDKFAFVLPEGIDLHSQMLSLIKDQDLMIHDMHFNLKFSIGISKYDSNIQPDELLKRAEIAMYQVKQNGKGNYDFYDASFTETVEQRLLLSNALEKSIDKNELSMVYQPIYEAKTHRIHSYEALVRWHSEGYGFVSPLVFIDLAEQSGFIKSLSQFTMEEASKFSKSINDFDAIVSINISGIQLLDPKFSECFYDIINSTDISPKNVGLEVTETAVIENIDLAINELTKLRELGVTIYLDDFGTGYSSLSYLSKLPIDILKIDKSFIDDITHNKERYSLVKSIIQLAKDMGLKTTAEGVETKEQLEALEEMGCDYIQGYYFSKPLSPAELKRTSRD